MLRIVGMFGGFGARKTIEGIEEYTSYATQTLRVQVGTLVAHSQAKEPFIRAYYHPISIANPNAPLVLSITPTTCFLSQEQDWQKELEKEYSKLQSRLFIAERFFDTR